MDSQSKNYCNKCSTCSTCTICNTYIGYLPKSCDYKKLQYINLINNKCTKSYSKKNKKINYF